MPRIIVCRQPGDGGYCVYAATSQKEACQCVPAESDALPKGGGRIETPCSQFRDLRGVHSCGVRDLSDGGVGVRLNDLPLLPTEFNLSFDGFRTTLACRLVWRNGDLAGITFSQR